MFTQDTCAFAQLQDKDLVLLFHNYINLTNDYVNESDITFSHGESIIKLDGKVFNSVALYYEPAPHEDKVTSFNFEAVDILALHIVDRQRWFWLKILKINYKQIPIIFLHYVKDRIKISLKQ